MLLCYLARRGVFAGHGFVQTARKHSNLNPLTGNSYKTGTLHKQTHAVRSCKATRIYACNVEVLRGAFDFLSCALLRLRHSHATGHLFQPVGHCRKGLDDAVLRLDWCRNRTHTIFLCAIGIAGARGCRVVLLNAWNLALTQSMDSLKKAETTSKL